MPGTKRKVGLWMIGVCGGIGSTVALGLAALRRKLTASTGLVSALPCFERADLIAPAQIVVGGHEVRSQSLRKAASELRRRSGLFSDDLIRSCATDLRSMQNNVRRGTLCGAGSTVRRFADEHEIPCERSPAATIERLSIDIRAFRQRHRLDQVVVVNVASAEPMVRGAGAGARTNLRNLQRALAKPGSCPCSTGTIYALAAMDAGCAVINFTPAPILNHPALRERAEQVGIAYMGHDGKTGETLVKSALAPMFAMRHLSVLSWFGQNILGNRDGAVLRDPKTRETKLRTKKETLHNILGQSPDTQVCIDYVESLDDWKVAWDFIHFQGFLGTKMQMQFIWQASDSILAAPLVIDLLRFTDLEVRQGGTGPMRHLACFFKDPIDVEEYDLSAQWHRLLKHVVTGKTR